MRSIHIGWLVMLLAPNGITAQPSVPRFLNESAKQDLDKASVALLANVTKVFPRKISGSTEGYRPIRVTLDVQYVIKGELTSHTVCVDYFALNGGILGHLPVWVEPGSKGIFFLTGVSPCFRVVNDSRAYIKTDKSDRILPTASVSAERFIAESTLPRSCAGNSYVYGAEQEIWSITIPLIGSRAAQRLLVGVDPQANSLLDPCRCLVAALVWKLPERCLKSLPEANGIPEQAKEIEGTNNALNLHEQQELGDDLGAWLETTVAVWGMDGALLRLANLMSQSGKRVSLGVCTALNTRRESASFASALRKGLDHSNALAERAAVTQFGRWVQTGCPTDWKLLESPAIDH
jgi:hypothetical protein